MNFNRMTIRPSCGAFQVFKMKPDHNGAHATDMASRKTRFTVSRVAAPRFTGNHADCMDFIEKSGAEYMSEHGLPV